MSEQVPSYDDWERLYNAARSGDIWLIQYYIQYYLENGYSINQLHAELTSLGIAVQSGHYAAASFLLERGADPDICGHEHLTPLYHASKGDYKMAELLLRHNANPNGADIGIEYSDIEYSEEELEDIEESYRLEYLADLFADLIDTPLIAAVKRNEPEIVALLLLHGADPTIRRSYGETALDIAEAKVYEVILGILRNALPRTS